VAFLYFFITLVIVGATEGYDDFKTHLELLDWKEINKRIKMREENLNRFSDVEMVDSFNHYYLVYKPLIRDLIHSVVGYS
jgi:hypothetical protein